jgi:hypothetical protein
MRTVDVPLVMQRRRACWQCGVLVLTAMASTLSTREAVAQQNLFNVPVPAVAAEDKIFFQEQLNVGSVGSSNTTFDYGLGNNFEIGLNVFNVGLYPAVTPPMPGDAGRNGVLINMQKVFEPNESFDIGIGTQQGVSATTSSQQTEYMGYGWCVVEYDTHNDHGRYLAGTYIGNPTYTGKGNSVGWMLGCEYPLIPEKMHFMADWLGGTNQISVAVIGAVVELPRHWQLSVGAQVPSPGSHNPYGMVIELTRTASNVSRGKGFSDFSRGAN